LLLLGLGFGNCGCCSWSSHNSSDFLTIKYLGVIARLSLLFFFLLGSTTIHIDVFLTLFLVGKGLQFLSLGGLGILVFFDLAGWEFVHSFDLLFVFLVFYVFVSVQIIVKVYHLTEGDTIQDLHSLERGVVESESVEGKSENRGACHEFYSFLCIHFNVTLRATILVVTFQDLWLDIVLKGHLYWGVHDAGAKFVPDRKRDILEAIFPNRLVATCKALDEALGSTLVQLRHAGLRLVKHFVVGCSGVVQAQVETRVDCVEKNTTKLLDVLLLKGFTACPVETFCKSLCGCPCIPGQLEVSEELLKLVGDAVVFATVDLGVVPVGVDVLSDLGRHEKRLNQRVHVTSGSLVLKTNVSDRPGVWGEWFDALADLV
jgi:hypothetical protein